MRRISTLLVLLCCTLFSFGQSMIGRQIVDQYPVDAWGDNTYGLTWLPQSYNSSSSTRYPLIIFLHGSGEGGSSVSSLNVLVQQSPPALPEYIAKGFNATARNPRDGKTYEFIVCSPQAPSWSYSYNELKYILPGILKKYRVDPNRIYLTGLSAGAGGAWTVLGSGDASFASQFAAMVCVNTAGVTATGSLTDVQVQANVDKGMPTQYGVAMYSVTGVLDGLINTSWEYMNAFNRSNPSSPGKFIQIAGIGHSTWGQAYDPTWRPTTAYYGTNVQNAPDWPNNNHGSPVEGSGVTQDSLNIYEWMLLFARNVAPPSQPAPPQSTPPTQPDPPTQPTPPSAQNPPPPANYSKSIPGKFEAEAYDNMSGIQTESTSDAGGGLNVGWIDWADWMDYNVNVTNAGTYTAYFRVAAMYYGAQLQLRASDGSVLTTVDIPVTGNYQSFETLSANVTLPAGNQTLRVVCTQSTNFNINWLDFETSNSSPVNNPPPSSGSSGSSGYSFRDINVDLYGGQNAYGNPQWNDWNINVSAGSDYFHYYDGNNSGASAILTGNDDVKDNSAGYAPDGSMAPPQVLRYTSYSQSARTLYLQGLDPNKVYDLDLFASRNANPGNSTTFAINQYAVTVSTYNNLGNKASFSNLTPDSKGRIVVGISSPNSYNYLNGFIIHEHTGGTTNAAVATGTSTAAARLFGIDSLITSTSTLSVFPNPATDHFNLQINNNHLGRMDIQIVDPSGTVRRNFLFSKDLQQTQVSLPSEGLAAGTYFIRIQIGNWSTIKKVLKL